VVKQRILRKKRERSAMTPLLKAVKMRLECDRGSNKLSGRTQALMLKKWRMLSLSASIAVVD